MRKTLTIEMDLNDPSIKLTGLSLKRLKGTDAYRNVYRDSDDGKIRIDTHLPRHISGKTAKVKLEYLISICRDIYSVLPFDKVTIKGHYELSSEQLFNQIINNGKAS